MTEKTLGTMGRIHMGEKRKLIVDISFFFHYGTDLKLQKNKS
jgi:hypothetical protein